MFSHTPGVADTINVGKAHAVFLAIFISSEYLVKKHLTS